MRKRTAGNILISIGCFFVLCAGLYFGYNEYEEYQAVQETQKAINHIYDVLENRETVPIEDTVSPTTDHVTDIRDGVVTKEDIPEVTEEPDSSERYGLTGMPVIDVDGIDYAASVCIPSINIELPVADDPSLENLKISPVRYQGSLYDNDLVIAGHNYRAVFSKIKNMKPGDEVLVTDMRGDTFSFTVSYLETIDGYDMTSLFKGEWDLTLLTCTYGGTQRVLVRCNRSAQHPTA